MPDRYEFVVVTCRKCRRVVYKPVESVPIASHARWRCSKCGNRGVDLIRTWSWNKPDMGG